MNDNRRLLLDKRFHARVQYRSPAQPTRKPAQWVRTDWDSTAAVGVGICAMIVMTTCFYFIF